MNMITFTARKREKIVEFHTLIADALEKRDTAEIETALTALAAHTLALAQEVAEKRNSEASKTSAQLPYLEMKYL